MLPPTLQSCTITHVAPSKIHHLYWYDPWPPVAAAVNVVADPAGCGGCWFAVSPTCSAVAGVIGYGSSALASSVSVVVVALRAHTATTYAGFGTTGCEVNVLLVLQSFTTVQSAPSKTKNLY